MNNILEYLEKTAAAYPYHTAVDDGNLCFTWEELTRLSRKIGTAFCTRAQAGKPIVLLMEKSALTLASMFGVVYAGCFYVMIDPAQPVQRIQEIFAVLSPEFVVTSREKEKILTQSGYFGKVYLLEDAMQEAADMEKLKAIRSASRDTDLLYGIFTSGSTGVPKGIVVSHRAVIDFMTHFVDVFAFTKEDRLGNQAPFDFDVSVKDIYTCVMTGATLILIPKKLFATPALLLDYLCDKKINTLIWAVSALVLVSALKGLQYKVPQCVKRVLFSGEVMPIKQLKQWQAALPTAQFVNLYGPTEITCNCTYYPVKRIFQEGERLPLGREFPGRQVFLLDRMGQEIVVPGKIGEICVSGESLAEGYYRNPEETKAKFIEEGSTKMRYYRTGDLGCYGMDKELYFSGRKDFQVKHMGHRIELEEIECAMNQIDGLEKSCCLMDQKRNQLIAFYYGNVTEHEVRLKLKMKVPAYMIPHKIIPMDTLPLNKNGKTDREFFRKQLEEAI